MSFGNLAKMAQQMQAEMARVQAELAELSVEGSAGGGAVTAVVNGHGEVVSVRIDQAAVDPDEVELLQDLVTAAVNDGLRTVKRTAEEKMTRVTGGMQLPPGLR
jgi:DNA-binding YbaB/EbfC family protein